MSLLIAVISALAGAASAGLFAWLQALRTQTRTAEIARAYLSEDLQDAETKLAVASQPVPNWWWTPVAPLPTAAWDQYHEVLREDLADQAAKEVVQAIDELRRLNARAATQWEEADRREATLRSVLLQQLARHREAPRPGAGEPSAGDDAADPHAAGEFDEELDRLAPTLALEAEEQQAVKETLARLVRMREQGVITKTPSRLASRRKRGLLAWGIPAAAAFAVAVVLIIVPQPNFTSEKLADAVAKHYAGSVVSCDPAPGHAEEWDCAVAFPSSSTTGQAFRPLYAAGASPPALANTSSAATLKRLIELFARREQKTKRFFAYTVAEDPAQVMRGARPVGDLNRVDGVQPVPTGPPLDESFTGVVE